MGNHQNDIERYLRGEMTAAEMHALEKEALQDPFLSEALEGADQAGTKNFLFDLKELHRSVHQKTRPGKPKIISMWNWSLGIAAGLMLLAVTSIYLISTINDQQKKEPLAAKEETSSPPGEPSLKPNDEKQEIVSDSTPSQTGQQRHLSLQSPVQDPQSEKKRSSTPEKIPQPSTANPAAGRTAAEDEIHAAQLERVAQIEPPETEDQKIVEVELSEFPGMVSKDQASGETAEKKEKAIPALSPSKATMQQAFLPTRKVQGKVRSTEDGAALPGVNVLVKGTSIGAITDAEGNYQISLNDPNQELVFAFIGMKPVEVTPGTRSEVDVEMSPDFSELSEVVVTGYGADRPGDPPTLEFAEPKGGRKAYQKYLQEKMHYPEQALENKVEGRVTIQFTVGANGELADFVVLKGLGFGCDDEVIRLVKEGPAWSPSKRNAQPIPEKVKVRLKFAIPDK